MKNLALICLAIAVMSAVSACAIFGDDDKPVTTTTTTEETHVVHAPAVGVSTQTVQSAY